MSTETTPSHASRHLRMVEPADWFRRFQPLIRAGGTILDVAAGGGRHVRFFSECGHDVTAVDKNTEPLHPFSVEFGSEVIEADLEDGSPWPLGNRAFDAVIVCNYLHRPLFPSLIDALSENGVLLYETFALGNEIYSRPRNPDHLLKSGELLSLLGQDLQVVAYQHGIVEGGECPGVKQMIATVKNKGSSVREDGEPMPFPVLD